MRWTPMARGRTRYSADGEVVWALLQEIFQFAFQYLGEKAGSARLIGAPVTRHPK
jgi:hypothetical protein